MLRRASAACVLGASICVVLLFSGAARAATLRTTCHWTSGSVANTKLMVRIEIDAGRLMVKETYSFSDGSKFPGFDRTEFSEEYENGRKVESASQSFVDVVTVSGDNVAWSRKGRSGWIEEAFGNRSGGKVPDQHYERMFSLDTASAQYKEHLKTEFGGVSSEALANYACSALSTTP